MFDLFSVFGEVLLPVIVVVAVGFTFRRFQPIDTRSVNRINLYVLAPCLIFSTLIHTEIPGGEAIALILQMALVLVLTSLFAWLISMPFKLEGPKRSGFILTSTFMNSGNFGLSVAKFAFGTVGFQYAILSFLTQALLGQVMAIYLASAGRMNRMAALGQVLRMPMIYAALAGVLLRFLGFRITEESNVMLQGIQHSLQLLGDASVPLLLLILGMQLAIREKVSANGPMVAANVLRLLVSVPLAYGIGSMLGLTGLALTVGTIQAAMPTAVNMIVLAVEYDAWPEFVSSGVVITTLFSMVTLTLLIAMMR
jgi:predicted permease